MEHNLVIFDVDGTLTQTACMDSEAYLQAFVEYLPLSKISSNWHEYRYSTDSGFAIEIFEKHMNRLARDEEIKAIKEKFFFLLEEKINGGPNCCLPLPGAKTVFQRISLLKHWDIAIATGCWLDSALTKLKYAEINHCGIPLVCSDDHIERREIIKIAIERSKLHYNKSSYDNIIYAGDQRWDYDAAKAIGVGFIGIGDALKKTKLNIPIIDNYIDGKLFSLLNSHPVKTILS